jgi:hypothetical protein
MGFTKEQVCKSRHNCIPCRRDAKFRGHFEKQYGGPWECPLNIPIDAKDDAFPEEVLKRYREMLEKQEERSKKTKEVEILLDELVMATTGEVSEKIEKIRSFFFPNSKIATKCSNSSKQIGEVDQVCCGGTIKKVPAYNCSKHMICTDKKCQGCQDFTQKR